MNKRDRNSGWENLQKRWYWGAGAYQIPKMRACRALLVKDWVDFECASSVPMDRRPLTGVHFFLYDRHFERLWRSPDVYVPMLRTFGAVAQPDFSIYTDFPEALRIYNVYRNAWLGCYLQEKGVNVVPTLLWSDERSDAYCWDGYPETGIFMVSTVGSLKKDRLPGFLRGWEEMQRRLAPDRILVYGKLPPGLEGQGEEIEPFVARLRRRAGKEEPCPKHMQAGSEAAPGA